MIIYVFNASRMLQFSSCLEIKIYAGSKEKGTSLWDCVLVRWSRGSQPQTVLFYEWMALGGQGAFTQIVLPYRCSWVEWSKWSQTHAVLSFRWSWVKQVFSNIGSSFLKILLSGTSVLRYSNAAIPMVLSGVGALRHRQPCPTDSPWWSRRSQTQTARPYTWSWVKQLLQNTCISAVLMVLDVTGALRYRQPCPTHGPKSGRSCLTQTICETLIIGWAEK